jgi:hypothetical protein
MCGRERTCGRAKSYVWQGKRLPAHLAYVWQGKELGRLKVGRSECREVGSWSGSAEKGVCERRAEWAEGQRSWLSLLYGYGNFNWSEGQKLKLAKWTGRSGILARNNLRLARDPGTMPTPSDLPCAWQTHRFYVVSDRKKDGQLFLGEEPGRWAQASLCNVLRRRGQGCCVVRR